eukprot:Hpha_TRINITY_DN34690_c0_g1::TRINITY_DN34690_c0_g1_i1::g.21125::m.21125
MCAVLLSSLVVLLLPCPIFAPAPAGEANALKALYLSTWKGPGGWRNYQNWMTGDPCTNAWAGVTCTGNKITRVALRNNNLNGNLPAGTVSGLPSLEYLDIAQNPYLTGTFQPNELASLPNLDTFMIGAERGGLTGPFPDWANLPNPVKLEQVQIFGDFTGTIPSFAPMPNVKHVRIDHTEVTGTIPDLGPLTVADVLVIEENNKLSGTIPDLTPLKAVTLLWIQSNDISGTVPQSLSKLDKLKQLGLSGNCGDWRPGQGRDCDLSGTLPTLHPNLANTLEMMRLHTSAFEDFPFLRSGTFRALTELYVYENLLTGTFPCHVTAFPAMKNLRFRHNRFTGTLPCTTDFRDIQYYEGGANYFTGTLPISSVGNSLLQFSIDENRLSGTIPQGFVDSFPEITRLELGSNEFTGTLPSLTKVPKLQTLHVHRNVGRQPLIPVATQPDLSALLDNNPATVYTCTPTCQIMLDFGKEVCLEALEWRDPPDTRPTFTPLHATRIAEGCPEGLWIRQGSRGMALTDTEEPNIGAWEYCCSWSHQTCSPGAWHTLGHARYSDHSWQDWDSFCRTPTRYYRLDIRGCANN